MSEITQAIKQICDEKGISYEDVMETIKAALGAAYRKDFGNKLQNIHVEFDPETMKLEVYDVKTVVEDVPEEEKEGETSGEKTKDAKPKDGKSSEKDGDLLRSSSQTKTVEAGHGSEGMGPSITLEAEPEDAEKKHFNPKTEIQLKDAKAIKKSYKIGDVIQTNLEVHGSFGRMAAQTAKQVIIQKLREAERETVYNEFKGKENIILIGTVQRREGKMVFIDLGKATALLPPEEQISRESYMPGEHCKVLVVSVNKTSKGPGIIVSRARPELVAKFFEMEIPEIANHVVEIKGIAREAGSRTKIAVWSDQENIDPIGSCIGQRGARVQTIISELKGEKIDIIFYNSDPEEYIINALKPAKINSITINKEAHFAIVRVSEDQLSLAIGKAGQNVRLAARLTGWKIDIEADKGEKIKPEDKQLQNPAAPETLKEKESPPESVKEESQNAPETTDKKKGKKKKDPKKAKKEKIM